MMAAPKLVYTTHARRRRGDNQGRSTVIAVSFFVFAGISLNDGLQSLDSNQYEWVNFFGRDSNSQPATPTR